MDIHSLEQWSWRVDPASALLTVHASDLVIFSTPYRLSDLSPAAGLANRWSLQDIEWFMECVEALHDGLGVDDNKAQQLACWAVAARNFYPLRQPKSWLFLPSTARMTLTSGNLIELQHAHGSAAMLVVEAGEPASTLMLLDERLIIDGQRPLSAGAILRVMNDRVQRYLHMDDSWHLQQAG